MRRNASRGWRASAAGLAFLAAVTGSEAEEQSKTEINPYPTEFMGSLITNRETKVHFGYGEFCQTSTSCDFKTSEPRIFQLTPKRWQAMVDVTKEVNHSITYTPDKVQYGVDEKWALPKSGKGDCEDFALLKRKKLRERGFPRSALLLEVGWAPTQETHVMLVVRTDKGDFVLDNMTDEVRSVLQLRRLKYRQMSIVDPTDFSKFRNINDLSSTPYPGENGHVAATAAPEPRQ